MAEQVSQQETTSSLPMDQIERLVGFFKILITVDARNRKQQQDTC